MRREIRDRNILFLCDDNACLSQITEATAKHLAPRQERELAHRRAIQDSKTRRAGLCVAAQRARRNRHPGVRAVFGLLAQCGVIRSRKRCRR